MNDLTDNELILKYREGNSDAFAVLLHRYLQPVFFFCSKMVRGEEANDMTQEVFVKVWKNIRRFDEGKSFKVWIFRIARNTCLDFLRKKKSVLFSELQKEDKDISAEDLIEDKNPSPFEKLSADDLKKEIDELLEKLPAQTKLIFELYYRNQMTFQEIADSLKLSVNTVKSRHLRGLKELRESLNAPK